MVPGASSSWSSRMSSWRKNAHAAFDLAEADAPLARGNASLVAARATAAAVDEQHPGLSLGHRQLPMRGEAVVLVRRGRGCGRR
jgi:hypothetical protein